VWHLLAKTDFLKGGGQGGQAVPLLKTIIITPEQRRQRMRKLPEKQFNTIRQFDLVRVTERFLQGASIDLDRLRDEVALAEQQHEYTNKAFHGWSSIPLRSINGMTGAEASAANGMHASADASLFRDTSIMESTPYIRELVQRCAGTDTGAGVLKVRLMKLAAGKCIAEHRDRFEGSGNSIIRLHIPIVTHRKVHFFVNGKQYHMDTGELYRIDVSQRHAVKNLSRECDRIHLVFDVCRTVQTEKWLNSISH
jgi:hypothetical protein